MWASRTAWAASTTRFAAKTGRQRARVGIQRHGVEVVFVRQGGVPEHDARPVARADELNARVGGPGKVVGDNSYEHFSWSASQLRAAPRRFCIRVCFFTDEVALSPQGHCPNVLADKPKC
jgi:hypothetical protein